MILNQNQVLTTLDFLEYYFILSSTQSHTDFFFIIFLLTPLECAKPMRNSQINMSVLMKSSLKQIKFFFSLLHFQCTDGKSFQFFEFCLFFQSKMQRTKKQSHRLIMFALMMLIIILKYGFFLSEWNKFATKACQRMSCA